MRACGEPGRNELASVEAVGAEVGEDGFEAKEVVGRLRSGLAPIAPETPVSKARFTRLLFGDPGGPIRIGLAIIIAAIAGGSDDAKDNAVLFFGSSGPTLSTLDET